VHHLKALSLGTSSKRTTVPLQIQLLSVSIATVKAAWKQDCLKLRITLAIGIRRNFSWGGATSTFACPFQVAVGAMQMDVHETLYLFYAPKVMPHVMVVGRGGSEKSNPLDFEI